jgi:hypothetical protein
MRTNRSLLNGLSALANSLKANETIAAEPRPESSSSASSSSRSASGPRSASKSEPKTIDITPHWPGVVRYLHANPDVKFWKKTLASDDSGWFAGVAAAHPDAAIAKMGKASPHYNPQGEPVGLKEHLASLGGSSSSRADVAAAVERRPAAHQSEAEVANSYSAEVSRRQAKLKPHSVCPECKTPKTPNEPCTKCGTDAELGEFLHTFASSQDPAVLRLLALADKAGVKPRAPRIVGRLRPTAAPASSSSASSSSASSSSESKPKVKAAAEGADGDDATFVMVTIDVEVRPVTPEQIEAWENVRPGEGLPEELMQQLSEACNDDNIHFVEAVTSDKEGNLG